MSSVNLLEKNLEKILDLAGFDPKVRTKLEAYEIDVLLEYKSIQAIFECKQYQKGSLTVCNLIHEWTLGRAFNHSVTEKTLKRIQLSI